MKNATLAKGLVLGLTVILSSFSAFPGGLGLDLSVCTVDLSGPLGRAHVAVGSALAALGYSATDASSILADLDASLANIEQDYPIEYLPIPLVGGTIEFGVPFILIDEVVFSGGLVNDSLLRSIADVAGYGIPQPIVSATLDLDSDSVSLTGDAELSVFKLTSEVAKHLDLLIAGIELGAGIDLIQGSITPVISATSPSHQTEVDAALAAMNLDGFTWTTFAAHVSAQIEVGPPFLRLVAEGAYLLPISEESGWWDMASSAISGKIGVVIRF